MHTYSVNVFEVKCDLLPWLCCVTWRFFRCKMQSSQILLASFVIAAIDDNWTSKCDHLIQAVKFFANGSVPHIDIYMIATNATLSILVACYLLTASTQRIQRVEILPGKNLRVSENKSCENLAHRCCDWFGEIFSWWTFPTIRYWDLNAVLKICNSSKFMVIIKVVFKRMRLENIIIIITVSRV